MSTIGTARNVCADPGAFHYQRHRPEKTLLYQLVSKHYPVFRQKLAEEGRMLLGYGSPHHGVDAQVADVAC